MNKPTAWLIFVLALLVSLLIYFIPTIIARKKQFVFKLFLLNLFAGWTLIGWVIALIWALKKPKQLSQVQTSINTNTLNELEKLGNLTKQGILTDEEFDQQKAKILGSQPDESVPASTKQKLQIISAIIMALVMLTCLTCYLYLVPKYIYGEEATARRFLNSLQSGDVDGNLMQTDYLLQTGQNSFPKIIHYHIQKIKELENNQFIILANVTGRNGFGAELTQEVGVVIQKNYDQYKVADTYNLIILHDNKIVFPSHASDLQKAEALKNLPLNLQIVDWKWEVNYGSAQGEAIIKNNAQYPVKFIEAEIKYSNRNKEIINADKVYAVGTEELAPGESRTFTWFTSGCEDCNTANIYIKTNGSE